MSLKRLLILSFIGLSGLLVLGELIESKLLIYGCKPLLMPILATILISIVDFKTRSEHKLMLGGLLFSWFGDLFLISNPSPQGRFLLGLFSFLITHACYILAFANDTITPLRKNWTVGDCIIPLLLIVHSLVLSSLFVPNMSGLMVIAVPLYALLITLMGIAASVRTRDGFTLDRVGVLAGVILFILSDTLIGVSRFLDPDILFARPAIMILYCTGQLLIVLGWGSKKVSLKTEIASSNS